MRQKIRFQCPFGVDFRLFKMPFSNHSKKIDSRHKRKAIAGNLFSEKNQKSPKNFSVVSEKTFLLLLKSTFFESNRDVGHQKEKKIEMPSSIITGLKCVNKNLLQLSKYLTLPHIMRFTSFTFVDCQQNFKII